MHILYFLFFGIYKNETFTKLVSLEVSLHVNQGILSEYKNYLTTNFLPLIIYMPLSRPSRTFDEETPFFINVP